MDNFDYNSKNNRVRLIGTVVSKPQFYFTSKTGAKHFLYFLNVPKDGKPNPLPIIIAESEKDEIENFYYSGDKVLVYGKCEGFHAEQDSFFELAVKQQKVYKFKHQYKNTNVISLAGTIIKEPEIIHLPGSKRTIARFLIKSSWTNSRYDNVSAAVADDAIDYSLWARKGDKVVGKGYLTFLSQSKVPVTRISLETIVPESQMTDKAWEEFYNPESENPELTKIYENNFARLTIR